MPSPNPLTKFIAACEPGTPAGSEYYVERQQSRAERLFQAVEPAEKMRALLVGQTGVGKSTELARVVYATRPDFQAFRIPVDEYLDLDLATWHDILVLSACGLGTVGDSRSAHLELAAALQPRRRTEEKEVIKKQSQSALKSLSSPESVIERTKTVVTGGPPEPTPLQRFRNDFRAVHETIESGRAQYWDLALSVIAAVKKTLNKQLILILDGLEKMTLYGARRLFGDEGQFLSKFPCRMIATAPLALTFDGSFGQIEENFSYVERLRAVSVEAEGAGERFCRDLLQRRGASEICSEALLTRAIGFGAGMPRQLLQVLSYAAKQALGDGLEQISEEALLRACRRLSEKWQYQLGPNDYASLEKADEDREPAERARLLQLGACVEHDRPEGGLQIDVNPLVEGLIQRWAAKDAARGGRGGK